MKKLLLALILGVTSTAFCNQFDIIDFRGGIRNDIDSSRIADNEVSDSENMLFDIDATAKTRKGMTKANSSALGSTDDRNIYSQFEYRRSDGSSYHIAQSSTSLYYSLSSADFSIFESGLNKNFKVEYTVFIDTLCYVNGEIGVKGWNTSSTFTHTTAYDPKYIITWQNRLCISGDAGETSNVILSAFQDPGDWTLGLDVATGARVFAINTQDGQNVTGFAYSPNGNLIVFKEKSVWEIGGYDSTDFYQRLVIPDLGCADSGSVSYKDGIVFWLSAEGYVGYNGKSYSIVSDNIDSTLDNVKQLNVSAGSFAKNTDDEWNIYESSKSISISGGNLNFNPVVSTSPATGLTFLQTLKNGSTYFVVDNYDNALVYNENTDLMTNVDIGLGGFSPGLTTITNGSFVYNDGKINLAFNRYISGDNTYRVYVTTMSVNDNTSLSRSQVSQLNSKTPELKYASISFTSGNIPYVLHKEYDPNYTSFDPQYLLAVSSYTAASNTWSKTTKNLYKTSYVTYVKKNSNSGKLVFNGNDGYIAVDHHEVGSAGAFQTVTAFNAVAFLYFTAGDTITLSSETIKSYERTASILNLEYDFYSVSIATNSAGTPYVCYLDTTDMYLKMAYRVGANNWTITNVVHLGGYDPETTKIDIFIDKDDIIYITRIYNVGSTYGTRVYVKRPAQDWISFLPDGDDSRSYTIAQGTDRPIAAYIKPSLNEKRLVREATGYYESNIYDTGSDSSEINSLISESLTNRDNIYHSYRTSDTVANIAGESFTSITPNASVSGTLSKYVQYKIQFATDTLTDLAIPSYVDNFILNYKGSSKRLSSMFYDGRIWHGVSMNRADILDKTLVYDRNNKWTKFSSDIEVMNYLNLNGKPYLGSTDGYIYMLDVGNNDSGNAIDAYVITKSYDFGNLIMEKSMDHLFLTALKSGDWNMSISYFINRSLTATETFNVNVNTPDLINAKLPLTKRPKFFTVQYKISNENVDEPLNFMGLHPVLRSYPLR
jgi:hypothetical protein